MINNEEGGVKVKFPKCLLMMAHFFIEDNICLHNYIIKINKREENKDKITPTVLYFNKTY